MSLIKIDFTAKTKALSAEVNTNFINLLALQVCNEDFTALTNGLLVTFITAFPFKPGTLRVYRGTNGVATSGALRLRPTSGYNENLVGGNGVSFTLLTGTPPASTPLFVDYQKANV